ncbi:class I SAM-dependent methyltransferase [Clostridium chauvoei]|uniref:class I SAM-dependent methyltransferase n=1 Tax=Clostridium chauvoei TaxID=46867 RepID=UPI001C86657A|nr:class I SAM-dependent methyltransferase [Clostridium chauvoei]MBX7375534.1 class I SAM-dependent methyltransferase [Clostridium chauvoei]MBX7388340.1 class I SAM-dependent methyltransferase [Clostridium chauvoei]
MNLNVEVFNNVAKDWDKKNAVNEKKINDFLEKINIRNEDKVLDVGTGTGVLIPFILEKCPKCKIDAIDISKEMIKVAKSKYGYLENVNFINMNIEEDEFEEKYDKVILYSVFPYIQKKIETIYNLVNRNLNNGGKLIIAHSNAREYLNNLHKSKIKELSEARLIDIELQSNLFKLAGLDVIEAFENEEIYYLIIQK